MSTLHAADQADVASVAYLESVGNSLSQEYSAVYDALASHRR